MKFFLKKERLVNGETKTSYFIPTSTFVGGTAIFAIAQTIITILGNMLISQPKAKDDRLLIELKQKHFEVQLLQRILEDQNPNVRANSLKLLIGGELIKDEKNKILEMTDTPSNIPLWIKRPLEPINSLFEATSNKPNVINMDTSGNKNEHPTMTSKSP